MDFETTTEQIAENLPGHNPITQPGNPGIFFAHQTETFRQLITTAHAFSKENWFTLPVLPRWHVLLIAPTGTGKSHLIHALAKQLGWPIYSTFVTRWIIAGGRGSETWTQVGKWLSSQRGKCIILLDEIDKIGHDDTWSTHLKTEVYQLLDRDLPAEIAIDDSDSERSKEALWARAKKVLMCDTFLVGAGAFQNLWDHRPKSLGFGGDSTSNMPSPQEMKTVLPPELINRFGQFLALPPLTKAAYIAMTQRTAAELPAEIRQIFVQIAEKNLAGAVADGKGARFVEECLTQALLQNAEEKPRQKTAISRKRAISP